jgi:hypothetical protein
MTNVKVNIFISHAPEDKPAADRLVEWLYSMRDEVNVWHYNPPQKPAELPLSWKILLPWYRPDDPRIGYAETLKNRRENAHIYIFLTSYKSLINHQVEEDLTLAISRRVDCIREDLAPLILPLAVAPSRWKEASRLARFEALAGGIPLQSFPHPDEGYLTATEQIAALAKIVQVKINEARFFQDFPVAEATGLIPTHLNMPWLGHNPEQFVFNPPPAFRPPDWMGWSLIALIFTISIGSYRRIHPAVSSLHLKARPDREIHPEYPRQPLAPPPDTLNIVFPPAE